LLSALPPSLHWPKKWWCLVERGYGTLDEVDIVDEDVRFQLQES